MAAVKIGETTISYDGANFYFDNPEWEEVIKDFHPGAAADTQDCFESILSFLSAFAESRAYGLRRYGDTSKGENSNLFPEVMGEWADMFSDEFTLLAMELNEKEFITDEN